LAIGGNDEALKDRSGLRPRAPERANRRSDRRRELL